VRNDERGAAFETRFKFFLNEVVRFEIDVGRRFVEDEDFGVLDDGSGQAKELLLTHGEDGIVVGNGRQEAILALVLDVLPETNFGEDLLDFFL
jgi:hypothetical protein